MRKRLRLFALLLLCAVAVGCGESETGGDVASVEEGRAGEEGSEAVSATGASGEGSSEADGTAGTSGEGSSEADGSADRTGVDGAVIEDGMYLASFDTDSSMFHVNEALDGKGLLAVKGGAMTIHIVMPSKNVLNLFYGMAEDAKKDGASLIEPTTEEVTYDDGTTEEVYAFDVPVPAIGKAFDVALIGKKQVWYDHKVTVSDPQPYEGESGEDTGDTASTSDENEMTAEVVLSGGSGRASVISPAKVRKENGKLFATVEWSSPYYDYMIVDGQRYEPINTEGNSVFEIPIPDFNEEITVIADTTAMSKPHEIEYVLTFKK